MQANLHEKHRDRLKERFLAEGLDNFEPHVALEFLLSFTIPRKDTNQLAHTLIKHFGSFENVMEADPLELMKIEGVGKHTATYLSLPLSVYRYYSRIKAQADRINANDARRVRECVRSLFEGRTRECLYALCLNSKAEIDRIIFIKEGTFDSVDMPIRELLRIILTRGTSRIIIAHNHPGGVCAHSADDIEYTFDVLKAFKNSGIELVDHYVANDQDAVSILEDGRYNNLEAMSGQYGGVFRK